MKSYNFSLLNFFSIGLFIVYLLSDMYYEVGRLFDYIFIIVTISLVFFFKKIQFPYYFNIILVFIFFSPWIIAGFINGNWLLSLSISVGLLIVTPFTFEILSKIKSIQIKKIIELIIIISVFCFFIQVLSFYILNYYLDFSSIFGSIKSRGYQGFGLFRPHGLFQEPNAYSTVMITILYIYSKNKNTNSQLVFLSFISIVLSLSLWGIIIAPIIFLLRYSHLITIKSIIFFCFMIFFINLLIPNLFDLILELEFLERFDLNSTDSSRDARYGGLMELVNSNNFFLGNGVNSDQFQNYGANGISFIIHSFGLIGIVLMFLIFFFQNFLKWSDIIFIILIFTTYPIISYMFFWVTLAILIYLNKILCVEF